MSLTIQCDHCDKVLEQPGGLFFSAPHPTTDIGVAVEKYHLCVQCTAEMLRWIVLKPPR